MNSDIRMGFKALGLHAPPGEATASAIGDGVTVNFNITEVPADTEFVESEPVEE
jgi:hypothetical protein